MDKEKFVKAIELNNEIEEFETHKKALESSNLQLNDEYVSFETAKMLNKAGFDWYTKNYYSFKGDFVYSDISKDWNGNEYMEFYSAPTQTFAARWLREKHDTHILIDWGIDGYDFALVIKDVDGSFIEMSYHDYYPTFEECLEEGIKAVLKTL